MFLNNDLAIFKQKPDKHLKRILGFIDADADSKTFGCCDRNYWHYKLNDYSNARYQEACLILAFAYSDENCFLRKNDKALNLIKAIINFWLEKSNKNGSVDEIYPYEQSFCATAFGAYIIIETIELLGLEIGGWKNKLEKTGEWLKKNGNWHISNQIAASAIGLYNFGKALNRDDFLAESGRRAEYLIAEYDKKKYFPEYGGFDLGYCSITMSCLSRLYQKTGKTGILNCLKSAAEDFDARLDKYGNYDNINMSRHTAFLYPFGFKSAKIEVLRKIKAGLEADAILNPDWLDDRYLTGLSNDYLMAYYF
ncbi:MAG: hypothetical protein V1667_02945 [bacterium]